MNLPPPVICCCEKDVVKLAEEMRAKALSSPDHIEGYTGSATVAEAVERAEAMAEADEMPAVIKMGLCRVAIIVGLKPEPVPVSITYTLRVDEKVKEWNFSIALITGEGVGLVPADVASMLAECFLGQGYEEVAAKAVFKTIRHYVKNAEDIVLPN